MIGITKVFQIIGNIRGPFTKVELNPKDETLKLVSIERFIIKIKYFFKKIHFFKKLLY
jgi:rRNA processing protein Gar1